MALAFVSSTAPSAVTNSATSVPIGIPVSTAAGDILVLFVATKPYDAVIATPVGWNPVVSFANGTTGQGADTGSMRLAAFIKEATGTETTLSISIPTGNSSWACIARYTKAAGTVCHYEGASGSDASAGATWSVTFSSNPGITSGDHVIMAGAWPTDAVTPVTVPGFTATSATMSASALDQAAAMNMTTGNDCGGSLQHANCTAGTASANGVFTQTHGGTVTNNIGAGVIVRLRETAPGTPAATLTVGAWR